MTTYTTIQGDAWDGIAYKLYGREGCMDLLMNANRAAMDILVFSAGTVLQVPEQPETVNPALPAWRQ